MIEPISTEWDNIIGFRTDSTSSTVDLKPWVDQFNQKLRRYPKLRLLIEYVDHDGFSLDTLLEDLQYSFGQVDVFEKAAIITCKDWLQSAEKLAHEHQETQLKSFHHSEIDQAMQWIEQPRH